MQSNWGKRPLSELTDNFDGKRIPVKENERRKGPYPYYGASGIVDYVDDYIFQGEHLLVAEDGENLRTRNTPIAFIARGKYWVNNHAHILRGNENADTRFLCYALQVTDVSGFLTGSTMPKLTKANLSRIPIPVPPKPLQTKIADFLSAFDAKIELNRKMNSTLEQMAQALFKSWFIDFDPVKSKAAGQMPDGMDTETAALFPCEFEECDLGSIPKGWFYKQLVDVFEINPQRRLPKGQVATYLDMANVPTTGHRPSGWTKREMGSGMKFINGDTLLARITPCLENGKTAFVDFLAKNETGWGSTEFIVLRPKVGLPNYFAYLLCRHTDFRSFAIQSMTGTSGRQRVQADQLGKYKIAVPPPQSSIGDKFGEAILPLVRKISQNNVEAQKLAGLRDMLLPRLISGQLSLPDIVHGGV